MEKTHWAEGQEIHITDCSVTYFISKKMYNMYEKESTRQRFYEKWGHLSLYTVLNIQNEFKTLE